MHDVANSGHLPGVVEAVKYKAGGAAKVPSKRVGITAGRHGRQDHFYAPATPTTPQTAAKQFADDESIYIIPIGAVAA